MKFKKRTLRHFLVNFLVSISGTYLFMITGVFAPVWKYIFFVIGFVFLTGLNIANQEHIRECQKYFREEEKKREEEIAHKEALYKWAKHNVPAGYNYWDKSNSFRK